MNQETAKISKADVENAIEHLRECVDRWDANDDDSLYVDWKNTKRKSMSIEVTQAAMALAELCNTLHVEAPARRLILLVDGFINAVIDWAERLGADPENTDPQGGALWNLYQEMLDRMPEPTFQLPEPIGQLVSINTGHVQIARIYGWKRPDGSPDIDRVTKEIARPGSQYNPENWVHPDQLRLNAEVDAQWKERTSTFKSRDIRESLDPESPREAAREQAEAREDVVALASLPGMTAAQLCKMKPGLELHDAQQIINDCLVNAAPDSVKSLLTNRRMDSLTQNAVLNQIETYAELNDLHGQVHGMNDDGHRPAAIAKSLQSQFPGLTYTMVKEIISGVFTPPKAVAEPIVVPQPAAPPRQRRSKLAPELQPTVKS